MSVVAKVQFKEYGSSVRRALELVGAGGLLPQGGLIVLKPNLTNAAGPPVTTDVRMVEAVLAYCREHSGAEVVIGDGSGSGETADSFEANGYSELGERAGVRLVDLNTDDTVLVERPDALSKKKFHMPRILVDAFVISIPVLKDHSMVTMTGAMKNMFGMAPKQHYKMAWNKSKLHFPSTHKSVVDLCLYKKPELSVIDASVVLRGAHLKGRADKCGLIMAGSDPVAADAVGAEVLGHEASEIKYLRLANGRVGSYEGIEIIEG